MHYSQELDSAVKNEKVLFFWRLKEIIFGISASLNSDSIDRKERGDDKQQGVRPESKHNTAVEKRVCLFARSLKVISDLYKTLNFVGTLLKPVLHGKKDLTWLNNATV